MAKSLATVRKQYINQKSIRKQGKKSSPETLVIVTTANYKCLSFTL